MPLLRSMVIFFFAVVFSGAAQAATILVWGDSLSAGYGLKSQEAWPTLLQTRLEREGFRHTVVNASVSGETSAGGRSRLPAALDRHKPDLLILELGANDGLRGLKPNLIADNLSAMIRAAREKGARVLLVGIQMPPNYGPAYTRRFQQTFVDVAREQDVPLVPFLLDGFAERREMFQSDGIHPTAEAQEIIVDTVWKQLAPMLKG
ncbi:MAG: arylesterase [Aromatoleum sp.]|jgi:acyl-CoA thioesterase-1|uniref:arylesterase n=1 Tax=Aromatoleum sp. TaxID=2307007 RepID=UPI00289569E9|nr:arylesterase [Aromatoleum sp.]MDT3671190.1 arylesterase [Aromatoleum sp.]